MSSPGEGLLAPRRREVDEFLDDELFEADVPGGSLTVFDVDGPLYATGYGARDLDEQAPATADTLYHVGSVTKVLTAVAVLQQVERGTLALDDAVGSYVDFLSSVPGDAITVRELLTHSSGMPSAHVVGRENVMTTRDLRLHLGGVADRRVTDDPPFMYYNSGYKTLGELVAAVDGRSYTDYVEQEVLSPLGMERSTFDQESPWAVEDAATGYRQEGADRVATETPLSFESQPADGGLLGTPPELARLLRCLMAGESPTATVPGLALRTKLDAVTGTYEGYRGSTAVVERTGGYLTVTFEEEDESIVAFPESTAPDDRTFYRVRGNGRRQRLSFRDGDDGTVLLWDRFRLERT